MDSLLRFIDANGLNSQTIESLPSSELDHVLSISFFFLIFFMNVRRKNGEYEPATFSVFSAIYSDTSQYEKKYPSNILKDNEFKNREEF